MCIRETRVSKGYTDSERVFMHCFPPTDSRSLVSHLSGEYVTLCFPADLSAAHFLMRALECQILRPLHHLVCFLFPHYFDDTSCFCFF